MENDKSMSNWQTEYRASPDVCVPRPDTTLFKLLSPFNIHPYLKKNTHIDFFPFISFPRSTSPLDLHGALILFIRGLELWSVCYLSPSIPFQSMFFSLFNTQGVLFSSLTNPFSFFPSVSLLFSHHPLCVAHVVGMFWFCQCPVYKRIVPIREWEKETCAFEW